MKNDKRIKAMGAKYAELHRMFSEGEERFWAKRGIKIKNSWKDRQFVVPAKENLPDEQAKPNQ